MSELQLQQLQNLLQISRKAFDEVYALYEHNADTTTRLLGVIDHDRYQNPGLKDTVLFNSCFDLENKTGLIGAVTGLRNVAYNAEIEVQNVYINAILIATITAKGLASHGQEILEGLNKSRQLTYHGIGDSAETPTDDDLSRSIFLSRSIGDLRLRVELDYIDRWEMYYRLFGGQD